MTGEKHLPLPRLQLTSDDFMLTDEAVRRACGVALAFTGRGGGVSEGAYSSLNTGGHVGDEAAAVERNREIALAALGAQGVRLVVPSQVHGTRVLVVEDDGDYRGAEADAVVAGAPGVAVLLNFADCLPLIVVSPSGRFAVAHAGWRGAVAGIAGKAARALAAGDPFGPESFNAYIGPHIRQDCFEVGADVAARFASAYGEEALADPAHVSLARAVETDLVRAGLLPERVADAAICTKCNPDRYFSYRATNGNCGRQAALAVRLSGPAYDQALDV